MTPDREREIRRVLGGIAVGVPQSMAADLLAEVDRLRALPVIATCGECRWCHPSETCTHPKAHAETEIDGCACAPPEWCPMRRTR